MPPQPTAAILTALDVTKSFGAQPVLDRVSLTVHEGDRIGLIGRNGCGKSTFLSIIAGSESATDGKITRQDGLRVVMLGQLPSSSASDSVGDVLSRAAEDVRALLARYHATMDRLAATPHDSPEHAKLGRQAALLQHEVEMADAWNLDEDIKRVTVALDLPATDRSVATLSGGERRRVDLAAALVRHPDLLLLDEPTNHLDVTSVQWIEDFLAAYTGSCILVTHDRYFLDRVVNRIVELEHGRVTGYPGNYERFLELKAEREAHDARTEANRRSLLRRELQWLVRQPKARGTKAKYRVDRYYEIEAQGPVERDREFSFDIPQTQRLGKTVIEAKKISRIAGGETLFRDFSLILQRGMRVGVMGPNGCGKTSLVRVLMGIDAPDKGEIVHGETVEFLYVDQSHDEVPPDQTILDFVSNGVTDIEIGGKRMHVPAYLERFLFDRAALRMPMDRLSGGERNRLDIAKKLLRGGNVLVLDEPTNDLDLQTLRVLEDAVIAFDGCAILVSHDRYFLNRLCTHLVVFERGRGLVQIAGNYNDYLRWKEEQAPVEAPAEKERNKPPRVSAEPGKRKLSYREQKELEGMEAAIHQAEATVARLEALANDPATYQQGRDHAGKIAADLAAARADVERLFARWAELESVLH
ncbi:MAG: ABC-F family ATP-binding cassette domain-containing protein [Candidatus Hydrogenedentes bacterium]|nr:ABC-F family ATP-binding cassette domain-containing protein [Candidatus Hydrogenedentota bacterium]